MPVDRRGSQVAPHDNRRTLHGEVQGKCANPCRSSLEIPPVFEISFPVMRATLSWCLCCRVASRTSRASTQSASCPAAPTTGPTWDRWPRPLCTRASSGLCWKSQLRCRKNRCVRVRLCYANIFIQCTLHVALRDCWVMAVVFVFLIKVFG